MIVEILTIAGTGVGVLMAGCTIAAVVGAGRADERMEAIQASARAKGLASMVERGEESAS